RAHLKEIVVSVRRLPVRPDLEQIHRQAKELLRAVRTRNADAMAGFREHHPESIDPAAAKLADFDELEIGEWLLDRGMDPNARAATDADGFGGYSALFSTAVSQRNFWVNYGKGEPDEARFTRLLLDRGADPNMQASIRARLEERHGGGPHREYRDVTPLGWRQYHARIFVSRESLRLIEARGGGR
ncbi:MAG TPA: hypothetical protein VFT47_10750, partial [Vicinamibacterales bacterium]|nr:hypothetical protein [Vicinamibacterales bacterium]